MKKTITMSSKKAVEDAMNKELSQLISKKSFKEIDILTLTQQQQQRRHQQLLRIAEAIVKLSWQPSNRTTKPSKSLLRAALAIAKLSWQQQI
eukprot:76042-Amphidinium_carterae.1